MRTIVNTENGFFVNQSKTKKIEVLNTDLVFHQAMTGYSGYYLVRNTEVIFDFSARVARQLVRRISFSEATLQGDFFTINNSL